MCCYEPTHGTLRIETTDSQQIHNLLSHLVLIVDEASHHLLFVAVDVHDVEVKVDDGCSRLPCDIHQTIDAYGI